MNDRYVTNCEEIIKNINLNEIWNRICNEAEEASALDTAVSQSIHHAILSHDNIINVIIARISERLAVPDMNSSILSQALHEISSNIQHLEHKIYADVIAFYERDAACHRYIEPILYFKGFLALQVHRFAHAFLQQGRKDFSYFLQSRSSSIFQTDIHPAAQIGCGILLDHATGLVVGETAVIENNVSILHGVTLGGTGKQIGDRHPKIRHGVLIGAGAKILGNIEVGACARIASGTVVLKDVPAYVTVAGVPAKIVGTIKDVEPAQTMDQCLKDISAL